MSDEKSNRGIPDRDWIDLNDEDEVRDWTTSLGVTRAQLEYAVRAAGNGATVVRDYIGRHRAH